MAQATCAKRTLSKRLREWSRGRTAYLAAICLAAAICVAIGVGIGSGDGGDSVIIESDAGSASADSKKDTEQTTSDEIYVDVSGAVNVPGVYRLEDGERIAAAIEAAGGLAPDADVSQLNRASKATDGLKIYVPTAGERAAAADAAATGDSSAPSSGLVSINNGTLEELQTLSGVGPSTAQAIIDDRNQNGPFASLEDLMRVSGIGEKKFAKLKSGICL